MVPNKWWCPLKRAWYGTDGIALEIQWANDPGGWLCRCIRAGSGHKAHTDLHYQWGEPSPVQWQRTPLCPGQHNPWSPGWEGPCAALLWGCSQGMARHRAAPELTALCWGSCGFHLTKMFPWRVSSPHSCCRGLPPCQVQSSTCLLRFQMLPAHQAKCALSSTCYLEVAPDECSDCRRFVSLIWGEGRKGGGSLLPGDEHVAQMEAGAAAGGWGGAIFICRQTGLPWGQLCHQENPVAPGCKEQGAALTFPLSLLPGVLWEAMPLSHSCGQGKLYGFRFLPGWGIMRARLSWQLQKKYCWKTSPAHCFWKLSKAALHLKVTTI